MVYFPGVVPTKVFEYEYIACAFFPFCHLLLVVLLYGSERALYGMGKFFFFGIVIQAGFGRKTQKKGKPCYRGWPGCGQFDKAFKILMAQPGYFVRVGVNGRSAPFGVSGFEFRVLGFGFRV